MKNSLDVTDSTELATSAAFMDAVIAAFAVGVLVGWMIDWLVGA